MATTLKKGPLQVSITETYTLNGREQSVKTDTVYDDIRQVSSRIVTVGTDNPQVLAFGAVAEGTYVTADVRYLRITNLDDENDVILATNVAAGENDEYVTATLAPGASHIFSDLSSITTINLDAQTAACDVEIFIASVEA